MSKTIDNLSLKALDQNGKPKFAVFTPALSTFYAKFVGFQQAMTKTAVNPSRIPSTLENGIEGLNWLNESQSYFPYKWALYSAGHAELNIHKAAYHGDDMVRQRDRSKTFVLGDSGGFQIGKNVWEGDWKDINCPNAKKKRKQVLEWLDAYMDYGMILDIPVWSARNPDSATKIGIGSYYDAVKATQINNDYFMQNRTGSCKFLNVLQGENHTQADDWYDNMKQYCDPSRYSNHFEGWAMGGQNMCSPTLALKRIIALREDKLLEKGKHDWIHFLGTSKLEWACFLTDIQNAVRKYHNSNLTISFDCASPFLATANGQVYTNNIFDNRGKWGYRMSPTADNKKYSTDTRLFRDAVLQDKIHEIFEDSPVTERLAIMDVCHYAQGVQNKIGKVGKTSWDSFTYMLLMAHNVHLHISAVLEANELYKSKVSVPKMLVHEHFDRTFVTDIVDEIFASDTPKALQLIDKYDRILTKITGTRGNTGKKEMNASTHYDAFFG